MSESGREPSEPVTVCDSSRGAVPGWQRDSDDGATPDDGPPQSDDGSASVLDIEVVDSAAGWLGLEPYWDDLLHETPEATVFQLFRVQRLWWRHFGADSRLFIVVVRQGAEVCAIAPLRILTSHYLRRPRRLLKFIGNRREIDRPTILRRGDAPDVVRLVLAFLFEKRSEWDSLLLYDLPQGGTLLSLSEELFRRSQLMVAVADGMASPWVDVGGSWSEFLRTKSKVFRKTLRRRQRQLREHGALRVETHEGWPAVAEAFEIYDQVERRSWKVANDLTLARDEAYLRYHAALIEELGRLGKIVFRTLWVGDQPVAATFGLFDHGKFVSLHIVHDEAYKRFSPGVVLTAFELEACYSDPSCNEYDFLGGHPNNKVAWTSNQRVTRDLFVFRTEALLWLYFSWNHRVKPYSRGALRRMGLLESVRRARGRVTDGFLRARRKVAPWRT